MVDHLIKKHGYNDKAEAREKATTFLVASRKSIWSCGFCVCVFESFKDRLGHLSKHFQQGLTLHEWQVTTEIQGLLLQPLVKDAWNRLLVARRGQQPQDIQWNDPAAVELRKRLQDGLFDMQGAQQVSEEAYAVSTSNETWAVSQHGNTTSTGTVDVLTESRLSSFNDEEEETSFLDNNFYNEGVNEFGQEESDHGGVSLDPVLFTDTTTARQFGSNLDLNDFP